MADSEAVCLFRHVQAFDLHHDLGHEKRFFFVSENTKKCAGANVRSIFLASCVDSEVFDLHHEMVYEEDHLFICLFFVSRKNNTGADAGGAARGGQGLGARRHPFRGAREPAAVGDLEGAFHVRQEPPRVGRRQVARPQVKKKELKSLIPREQKMPQGAGAGAGATSIVIFSRLLQVLATVDVEKELCNVCLGCSPWILGLLVGRLTWVMGWGLG